jgi:hypothetical protein
MLYRGGVAEGATGVWQKELDVKRMSKVRAVVE